MKYLSLFFLIVIGCSQTKEEVSAQSIIDKSIGAHGLREITGKQIEFDFRDKHYALLKEETQYTYTRAYEDSIGSIRDVLLNSSDLTRYVNNEVVQLDDEWNSRYSNSVNSVLYFVQLPLTLNDPAAIKKYQGTVSIKGKEYHQIEIRFSEDNGGTDFEDVFLYWFDPETFTMDYLAYSYLTDGGGVRFREVINRRSIDGIIFQDYINYKPEEKTTPLEKLSSLFDSGQLVELSRIENVNVRVN